MLLGWILRVIILAAVVLIVRLLIAGVQGMLAGTANQGAARQAGRRPAERSVALVKDPVCGVYVEPARAVSARIGSTVHYFCSEACERAFRQGSEG